MDRCKALFQRMLLFLLGAALLSQLALLPARVNSLAVRSISQDDRLHGSLVERDLVIIPRVNRIERYFTDAGSHTHFARALDEGMVREGARFICALNERNYLPASPWMDPSVLVDDVEGWTTMNVDTDPPILQALSPWLVPNGVSDDAGSYTTIRSRNTNNKPGTSGTPTGAVMKNIYNLDDGTVIVEDVTNPNAMPILLKEQYRRNVLEYQNLGIPVNWLQDPGDPSSYAIPALAKWSDIAYLQIARLAGGDPGRMQNVKRIIQYHIVNKSTQDQIKEALATVGKTITDVRIDLGQTAEVFPATSAACQALFKTPNGNGGYFLFAQHPDQLGSKTLDSISVFTSKRTDSSAGGDEDVSAWYFMVASFVDAPAQQDQ